MPNYDYICNDCGNVFEEFQKISDRYLPCSRPCNKCNKNNISIKIGMAAICDPVKLGIRKPDNGFKDVLSKIKGVHKKHTMPDRW